MNKGLTKTDKEVLMGILQDRFSKNMDRHPNIEWAQVEARMENAGEKLWSLSEMEKSGGEPDVVGYDEEKGELTFFDCAAESPVGRRSLCYDGPALESRKKNKPEGSAMDAAAAMGIQLLTEDQYRYLQTLGEFDTKTSSWILTPSPIRTLGGALFCDRRYDMVFVYHNGAESYYSARGFRGWIAV